MNKRKKKKGLTTTTKKVVVNPILAKARSLRSSLLRRVKSSELKSQTPTIKELELWLTKPNYICYYSLEPLDFSNITVDHKIPLNRNGDNTLDNLCICSATMNTAKGSLTEKEFRELLELIKNWEDGGERLIRRLKQGFFG